MDFQLSVQAIYRWKDEHFTHYKIGTELLLEKNRLKLTQVEAESDSAVAFCTDSVKKPGNNICKLSHFLRNLLPNLEKVVK